MRYAAATIFSAAMLFFATAEAQQPPSAFTGLRPAAQATLAQRALIDTLRSQRGAGAIHIARIVPQVLRGAGVGQSVQFNVALNTIVLARAVAVEMQDGRLLWRGEVAAPTASMPPGMATLVVSGDNVTGSIRTADGRMYRLRPLGGGETAIIQLDYATMPPDHPPDASTGAAPAQGQAQPRAAVKPGAMRGGQQGVALDASTVAARLKGNQQLLQAATDVRPVSLAERYRLRGDWWRYLVPPTIDVLVAYTPSAQAAAGDIGSLISLAVTETNDSFTNSNVWAQLRLVGTMPVTYNESGRTFEQMTAQLAGTSDGFMDNVHAQRDALHADIVVLIVNNGAYCGCADAIGATPETAFVVVHWGCATGYYSFGHEIGHLLGARHDRDDDATATPFGWGHGYRHLAAGAGWRTIMSYNCPANQCAPRLQYWSSPLTTWGGFAMGTATLEDNHRVWNERAATVAAFR